MHFSPAFTDSITRPFWLDQGVLTFFHSIPGVETWYISRDQLAGTAPFYSLYNESQANHLDSPGPVEGIYTADILNSDNTPRPHGYPWTSNQGGMLPLRRYYSSTANDHRTWLNSATPAGTYAANATYGATSSTPRFGYERYGNYLDKCSTISAGDAIGTKMENSIVRVGFNPIWGNAISELTHKPSGRQIVSHTVGDMVQPVIWYGGTGGDGEHILNPTQSGGADCRNYSNTKRWAGSPVVSATGVVGTDVKQFSTIVRPLNFCHNSFAGNDPFSPLAWKGQFRVTTTLACKLGPTSTTFSDVVQVRHEMKKDSTATFTDPVANMNNGGWFRPGEFGDFDSGMRAEFVDLLTGSIIQTMPGTCGSPVTLANPTGKGLRIVSADGAFALGFLNLGPAFRLDIWFRCAGSDRKIVLGTNKWNNLSSSTWTSDEVFFVVGTPTDVLMRMQQIYTDGGNCLL